MYKHSGSESTLLNQGIRHTENLSRKLNPLVDKIKYKTQSLKAVKKRTQCENEFNYIWGHSGLVINKCALQHNRVGAPVPASTLCVWSNMWTCLYFLCFSDFLQVHWLPPPVQRYAELDTVRSVCVRVCASDCGNAFPV